MTLEDLITAARRYVEDEGGFRWNDKVVTEYVVEAYRRIAAVVGLVSQRAAYNVVQSQQTYSIGLPNATRITQVHITPENSAESYYLTQLPLSKISVNSTEESTSPNVYALEIVEGGYELFLWPPPSVNITNGLLVDYEEPFNLVLAANDADAGELATVMPYPSHFDLVAKQLTASYLLSEMNDANTVQKGQQLALSADLLLRTRAAVHSDTHWDANPDRSFP